MLYKLLQYLLVGSLSVIFFVFVEERKRKELKIFFLASQGRFYIFSHSYIRILETCHNQGAQVLKCQIIHA